MKFKRLILGALALIMGVGAAGAQQLDMKAKLPVDPDVRIGKLKNGMTYYIRHNAKPEGMGEFHIYHDVGAIQEEDSQQGLAHFLEHMAFNGTKNMPGKQMIEWLEGVGVKFGANLNASTGVEQTMYMLSQVPLKREGIVDSALLILHDWANGIALEDKEIDNERGVIVEEARGGNNASSRIGDRIRPIMYGKENRYAYRNVIGHEELLRTFPYKEIKDFYKTWYRPDLQAVVIVGDFDVDKMEAKVKKAMGDIPAPKRPRAKELFPIKAHKEPWVAIETDPELTGSQVALYITRPARPKSENNLLGAAYENMLISAAVNSVNTRMGEIAQKTNAPFLYANLSNSGMSGLDETLALGASSRENELPRALEAAFTELERLRRHGITEQELEQFKANALVGIEMGYAKRDDRRSDGFVRGYMNHFSENAPILSAEDSYKISKQIVETIKLSEVNAAIAKMIVPTNNILVALTPAKDGVTVPTKEELLGVLSRVRASDIAPYEYQTVDAPLISHEIDGGSVVKEEDGMFGSKIWTLSNGVRVILKKTDFAADQVSMSANADGGLCNISDDDFLSASCMDEVRGMSGLGKFSRTELSKVLTGKNATAGTSMGRFSLGASGNSSKKDVETMLQLLYLQFTESRFDREQFDRMMEQYAIGLKNAEETPDFKLSMESTRTMYGDTKRTDNITSDRLAEIDFDKMPALYNGFFKDAVGNFTFYFIGDLDMDALKPLVGKYIGGLPTGAPKSSWKDDGVKVRRGAITNRFKAAMEKPKSTVSYLYTGDIEYTQENSMVMSLLSNCLSTRYLESIREEKGGTYGVSARGSIGRQPQPAYSLQIYFNTDPAMVDELLEIVEAELRNIAENGPREDDMAKTIEYWVKSRPESLKNNGTWMNYLQTYYKWGEDWNVNYDALVKSMTGAKVQALARKILDDGNLIKVIMDPQE